MKKKFNILYVFALIALMGFTFTACDDDDDSGVAKAVLASAANLNFEPTDNPGQIITVYSDATWTCEHPDWVIVEPETGSGTTEVRISVSDNLRDGTPDNPRKADVVFKGVTKASEAHVIVRQSGNKFRDVQPITIPEMEQQEEEAVAVIKNLTIVAPLSGAFVATDGTNNVYIQADTTVTPGDVLTVYGEKSNDKQSMPIVIADFFTNGGTKSSLPAPVNVSAQLDTYTSTTRTYIAIDGKIDGTNIVVKSDTIENHGVILASPASLDVKGLNGHDVTVYGFYAGTASPAFNMIALSVDDRGLIEHICFSEDFEWLAPWAAVGNGNPCGQTVETDDPGANAPQIGTPKVDDESAYQALLSKGYQFLATHAPSKKERNPEAQTYLQTNYLKFGLTGYYSGIVMPIKEEIDASVSTTLSFDWCSMRQGSGAWDATEIVVVVTYKGAETQYPIAVSPFQTNETYRWINEKVEIPAGAIGAGATITIRNADSQWPSAAGSAFRWFLDNVKLVAND